MPSRKGKGRQSLGFGRKSQRAAFHQEWQMRLEEDYYEPRHQQQRQRRQHHHQQQQPHSKQSLLPMHNRNNSSSSSRASCSSWMVQLQQQQQQRLLRANSTATSTSTTKSSRFVSPPGWLVYHSKEDAYEAESFAGPFLLSSAAPVPTLQSLAVAQLATSLPDYLQALGVDQLQQYLSLLPGPALSVLSVLISQAGAMTNDLCHVLGRQSQLQRFSLVACPKEEETDPSYKDLQPNVALQRWLPHSNMQNVVQDLHVHVDAAVSPTDSATLQHRLVIPWKDTVPESWEELLDDDDDKDDDLPLTMAPWSRSMTSSYSFSTSSPNSSCCCQLERLELGNLPLLRVEVVLQILQTCAPHLTHLGLAGSCSYDHGPRLLRQLSQVAPHLRVLDVSGNPSWVTEALLRFVYESYRHNHHGALQQQQPYNMKDTNLTAPRQGTEDSGGQTPDPFDSCHYSNASSEQFFLANVVESQGPMQLSSSSSSSNSTWSSSSSSSSCSLMIQPQQPQQQPQEQHSQQQQHSHQQPIPFILIKATGCLSKSSQLEMEMEFGTLV